MHKQQDWDKQYLVTWYVWMNSAIQITIRIVSRCSDLELSSLLTYNQNLNQKVQKKPKLLKQSYINYAELASFDKLTLFFWGGFNLEYGDLESGHLESRKWLSRI